MSFQEAEEKFKECLLKANDQQPTFNQGDSMPFALFNPESEGTVSWMCGEDIDGKIISTFEFHDEKDNEKRTQIITKEEALEAKRVLIENGWRPLPPPKFKFKYPDGTSKEKLNRKEKRQLTSYITKKAKKDGMMLPGKK